MLSIRSETTASRLLERAAVPPGTAPSCIAAALGYRVIDSPLLPARGMCCLGSSLILVAPCSYRPRRELTIAHELIELTIDRSGATDAELELACQRGAAALILPPEAFLSSVTELGWDLPRLRQRWPHASYETLGSRFVDLMPGLACAAWLKGSAKWRRAPATLAATTQAEVLAVGDAMRHGRAVVVADGVVAAAWALAGNGVRDCAVTLCRPLPLTSAAA